MPKPWAKDRNRRRKAAEAQGQHITEERERRAPVSIHSTFSLPASAAPTFPPSSRYHFDTGGVYGLHPGHPMRNVSGLLPDFDDSDDERELTPIVPVYTMPAPTTPRDFSALCSDSSHPWRTIRCRHHRLRPPCREQRPFPRSLPKRVSAPLPAIHMVAVDSIQTPLAPPLSAVDISFPPAPTPVSPAPAPIPILPSPPHVSATTLPAETAYGLVHSKFALACARELPDIAVTLDQVFDLVWGPYAGNNQKNLLVELPPDRLVFLCTLAAIVALEPVFEGFLQPVIIDFVAAWVDHCSGFG
ncbi:hypothetical protein C8J57DRAFT_282984 [Mycena rebaudengoi]|nr:hypothetical protein C8J57DRAFT_282984 [Mycena rebaudengoi]